MTSPDSTDTRPAQESWELIRVARSLSESFHRAKVPKEERAYWMGLLCLASADGVALEPGAMLDRLDEHARAFFDRVEQSELFDNARVWPRGEAARRSERALGEAWRGLEADGLGQVARSTDLLGLLLEAFLRYGNGAKELGIVLTPAHVCRFAAQILDIASDDLVYDPAAGTGGFLVAALRHAPTGVYGAEVSPQLACLARINLYLHGAEIAELRADSCFGAQLRASSGRSQFPEFDTEAPADATGRRITRVLMNPPFSLKSSSELETHFIDHALEQMARGGRLLAVIPSSVLYASEHAAWRASLLEAHRLSCVTLLPTDLFYPVATETVLMVLSAWEAHPQAAPVAWARVCDDGYVKRKGFRVPRPRATDANELDELMPSLRHWLAHHEAVAARPGYLEYVPIRGSEWLPQAHLGTPELDETQHFEQVRSIYRALISQRWDAAARAGKGS